MKRGLVALIFLLALFSAQVGRAGAEVLPESQRVPQESGVSGGAGTTLTGGTRGYRRLSIYGDVLWTREELSPYLWSEYGLSNEARRLSLGGGAWKDLREDLRVKGGLGFSSGRFKDSDDRLSSITLETGIERDLERPTIGAEYRYTAGTIGASTVIQGERRNSRGRGPSGTDAPYARFTDNEFSGYARFPAGRATLGLRAALSLPSYAPAIVSETASATIPISGGLAARVALSWEQGRRDNVYASAGLDCRFD